MSSLGPSYIPGLWSLFPWFQNTSILTLDPSPQASFLPYTPWRGVRESEEYGDQDWTKADLTPRGARPLQRPVSREHFRVTEPAPTGVLS